MLLCIAQHSALPLQLQSLTSPHDCTVDDGAEPDVLLPSDDEDAPALVREHIETW